MKPSKFDIMRSNRTKRPWLYDKLWKNPVAKFLDQVQARQNIKKPKFVCGFDLKGDPIEVS